MDDLRFDDLYLSQDDSGYGFSGSGGANLGYAAPASDNPLDNVTNNGNGKKNKSKGRLGNRFGKKGSK